MDSLGYIGCFNRNVISILIIPLSFKTSQRNTFYGVFPLRQAIMRDNDRFGLFAYNEYISWIGRKWAIRQDALRTVSSNSERLYEPFQRMRRHATVFFSQSDTRGSCSPHFLALLFSGAKISAPSTQCLFIFPGKFCVRSSSYCYLLGPQRVSVPFQKCGEKL